MDINRTRARAHAGHARGHPSQLTTPQPIDTSASDVQHIVYINESEALGSIPPPPSVKGMVQSGIAKLRRFFVQPQDRFFQPA